jgi:hypothetical protein
MEPSLKMMHSRNNQLKIGSNSVPIRPLVVILIFLLSVFVGWRVKRVQKTVAWGDLGKMEPYLESMHSHNNQLKIGLNSVPIRPLVAEIMIFLLLVFAGWRVERVQIIRRRREVAVENKYLIALAQHAQDSKYGNLPVYDVKFKCKVEYCYQMIGRAH